MLIAVNPVNHLYASPVRYVNLAKIAKHRLVNHIHVNPVNPAKAVKLNVVNVVVSHAKEHNALHHIHIKKEKILNEIFYL